MSVRLGVLALALALAWSPPARGAATSDFSTALQVELTAPAGCSSTEALFDAVHGRSTHLRRAQAGEPSALLQVKLERLASGVQGELTLRLQDGTTSTRRVTGVSCQAVVEALSLSAALSLDSAPAEPDGADGRAASPAAPTTEAARDEPQVDLSSAGSQQGHGLAALRPELGAQAGIARLVAPHLNVGGALVARLRWARRSPLSPALSAALLYTDNGLFESSRHAALQLTGVALSLCPLGLQAARRLRLEPCLAALGARLRATGRELLAARVVTRSWWGAGALARAALALSPAFGIEAEAGALIPLVSRAFVTLPDEVSLGHTPAVAPFANIGVFYVL